MNSLRHLPRLFVPGATADEPFELPEDEVKKLRQVLRLSSGAHVAVLPNDGRLIHCTLSGHSAVPIEVIAPDTEAKIQVTVAQALPKGDKLDDIVKACTGLGVNKFIVFPSERTVVHWDQKKLQDKLRRLRAIVREESEVAFRTRMPEVEYVKDLATVLAAPGNIVVLAEGEDVIKPLPLAVDATTLVVGPEGGWAPREVAAIGDRGVTLGPRVLRVEFAAAAAVAKLIL